MCNNFRPWDELSMSRFSSIEEYDKYFMEVYQNMDKFGDIPDEEDDEIKFNLNEVFLADLSEVE